MSQVRPCTHEVEGWLKFAENGLDPYWFVARLYLDGVDGTSDYEAEIEVDGEPWTVRFYYSKGSIAARESDAVDGALYEWHLVGRGPGEQKATFQLRPRYDGMRKVDGDDLSLPWDHLDAGEGVAVEVSASNVDPRTLPARLRQFLAGLAEDLDYAVDEDYFRRPILDGGPAASNVTTVERYVRLQREVARKVVHHGGTYHKLATHLSTTADGEGLYRWDNSEGQGYHHRLEVDHRDIDEVVPGHRYGKQVKHYLLENPEAVDEDDPTWHPKIGAAFKKKYHRGAVPWSDLDDVLRELDETLLNLLSWSDAPVEPGFPFVADDHFDAEARDEDLPIYADPTPELEAETEHLLVTALQDLTDADQKVLRTLAGEGSADYDDLADRADCSISTIYRCLDRVGEVLESDAGHVRFASQCLAEEIRGIVEQTEDAVGTAAERIARLYDVDVRQAASSAFQKWLAEYGADLEMRDGDPVLRIDTVLSTFKADSRPYAPAALREAVEAWHRDGRDVQDLAEARLDAEVVGEPDARKVSQFLN